MTRPDRVPVIVVAGVASGVGKTTMTLGLLEALRRRGLVVQAFKVGPDFIDPGFHALATGRPSYTLDGWMCGREHARATVARRAADADLAVIEGMMGCFDGVDGFSEDGSTAQVAKWLGAPALLLVDAGAQVRSAAAVVLGFERFDPGLDLAGVIFNRVGGAAHRRWLTAAVGQGSKVRVLGAIPWSGDAVLPERHLGLVTAAEGGYPAERWERLAAITESSVDLDAVLATARSEVEREAVPASSSRRDGSVTIAVARDEAFQFYYPENLDRLQAAGARLRPWSPLHDRSLPDADGLYLGGGYPELHGATLTANAAVRRQVKEFARAGRPVYAECGGLMYLAESLIDAAGAEWPMVGVLPARVKMSRRGPAIGYREVELTAAGPLGAAGTRARGHEFHCSTMEPPLASVARSYAVREAGEAATREEGFVVGGALMSYVHLHFGSNPALAAGFVEACHR